MKTTPLIICIYTISLYGMHDGTPFPPEIQQNIVSQVWDDDTLGSLSLVSKTMHQFVFDKQSIEARKKRLLWWHVAYMYANDKYLYGCYQTSEAHIFNKRHSALMVTNRYRACGNVSHQPKPSKHRKHQLWIAVSKFDAQATHGICWGYTQCDGNGYNGIPYFNRSGQPSMGRIDWEKESSVTDYLFDFSKQGSILNMKRGKEYYIDFEDGKDPQPLALLRTRFNWYTLVIMRAPIQYETPTAKICTLSSAALSPTVKTMFRHVFTWFSQNDNKPWADKLKLQPTDQLLSWALFAAHGGYKYMYPRCVQLYFERMMWPLHSNGQNYYPLWGLEYHYRFAKNKCSIDDSKQFHDYLYKECLREYKGEENFRAGQLQRYMQLTHPGNLLAVLYSCWRKIGFMIAFVFKRYS